MDQLSSLYVRMASGAHSQLHNPASVMGFVDQMQTRIDKSSVPRKTFFIDSCTPHSDTVVAESSALKPSVGWVTLKVTEGIRRGIHEWGIKIEHQGESNDESGLMIGIVPKNFSKYDTFISQGGGWCLSRAGKFYGHWRRNTAAGSNTLTFGTGDRVVLTLDYEASVMTVRVGEDLVVGDLSGLTMEVFPAVSLHYRHQHIRFEHHTVRETAAQRAPWLQRQVLPLAPAYMPLSFQEVQRLPLDSYLFSNLFQSHLTLESSSAITMEEDATPHGLPAAASAEQLGSDGGVNDTAGASATSPSSSSAAAPPRQQPSSSTSASSMASKNAAAHAEQRAMRLYMSAEASAARLTVLARAFAAVRRYVAVVPGKTNFLAPHVTAEYLRQRLHEAARESVGRSGSYSSGGGGGISSSSSYTNPLLGGADGFGGVGRDAFGSFSGGGCDAALNCGAVIVVHLFIRAVSTGQDVAMPLVLSFRDYLLSLPMYSLVEGGGGGGRGGVHVNTMMGGGGGYGSGGSALAPDTVQLAVDHIVRLLDAASTFSDSTRGALSSTNTHINNNNNANAAATVSPVTTALMEVALLLALQRGLVSEVLRVCRYLLRIPSNTLSAPMVGWLRRHTAGLLPRQSIPDINQALMQACMDPTCFHPTQIAATTRVLSVAYGVGSTLFLHTAESLARWGPSNSTTYVLLADTRQPSSLCCGATRSSMAATHTHLLLLTDCMAAEEVAVVAYSFQLAVQHVVRWADVHSSWPRTLHAHPQLATAPDDCVLLLFERGAPPSPTRTVNGAAASTGTPSSAVANSGLLRRSGAAAAATGPALAGRSNTLSTTTTTTTTAAAARVSASSGSTTDLEVVVHGYSAATIAALAAAPLWVRTLTPPTLTPSSVRSDRCLLLRKPSRVDLGEPEESLTVAGGAVTIELWAQFLDKEDGAVLYQHGDRSTNGEVFIELIKSEGSFRIRGGYRHGVRGSSLVSAPLPPTADSRPLHMALVFDGRWRLFFDGEEMAENRSGPNVALDSPKLRWTVGSGCTCLLTGLRVWRLSRTARELSRDFRRPLAGDEPGLIAQFLFNERSGNVAFNYVSHVKAIHAKCEGAYGHVACSVHPWRNYAASMTAAGTDAVGSGAAAAAAGQSSAGEAVAATQALGSVLTCARLHEWRDLTLTTSCVARHTLILSTPYSEASPFASKQGGHVLTFFDLDSGVAHRALLLIASRSPARQLMRSDPTGQLWELFEVDAGVVKGELEPAFLLSPTAAPLSQQQQQQQANGQRPRERVLAVVSLPLEENERDDDTGRLRAFADDDNTTTTTTTTSNAATTTTMDATTTGERGGGTREARTTLSAAYSANPRVSGSGGSITAAAAAAVPPSSSSFISAAASAESGQSFSRVSSFAALLAQPSPSIPYAAVAMWLLQLLAAHADADPGADQSLFTPLADDVGLRCVTEVRVILAEHVRVVRANNARRAVTLKGTSSWAVVAAALRVLLRLIRRARAFNLHPGPLGLIVVKESADTEKAGDVARGSPAARFAAATAVSNTEVTMAFLLRELHTSSMRRRTAPSALLRQRPSPTKSISAPIQTVLPATGQSATSLISVEGADGADSTTLLGLLADVLNEDGLTLSPEIVALARTVTIEGVGLFLPDVKQRARLLRDLLLHASSSSSSRATTTAAAAMASSSVEDRVPAMGVLLDAVAQSFTTVLAAAPLLCVKDGVASLTDVCDTLRTLLEESAAQWRRRWSPLQPPGTTTNTTASASSPPTRVASPVSGFTLSLSEAIASLQLLLLSACQGNRWETALSQLRSGGDGSAAHTQHAFPSDNANNGGGGGGGAAGGAVDGAAGGASAFLPRASGSVWKIGGAEGVVAAALDVQRLCFSQAASYHPCVRLYYSALFISAKACLSFCVEDASLTTTTTPRSNIDNISGCNLNASRAASLAAMVASLAPTFVTSPLHTALSAIPLVLTVEDGEWFLAELEALLRLVEQLLDAVPLSMSPVAVISESARGNAEEENNDSSGNNMNGATAASASTVATARRLLLPLRDALHYASVWVAAFLFSSTAVSTASVKEDEVRQRLGLASVTTTPTAQPTIAKLTATLDAPAGTPTRRVSSAGLRGSPAEEAAGDVWENALLEGGLWPAETSADTSTPAKSTTSRGTTAAAAVQGRRGYMAQVAVRDAAVWSAKQAALDPLAGKTSSAAAITPLITLMAAAVLHLSALPVHTFTPAQMEAAMGDLIRTLSRPVRTELMSRREADTPLDATTTPVAPSRGSPLSTRQSVLNATVRELQQRCELLLRVRSCAELWAVNDALFAVDAVRADASGKDAWRRVWHKYEQRHMRCRAHINSQPSCTLQAATQLVKHVVLSRDLSAVSLLAALRQRERLAALRKTGITHLLTLAQRAPGSAESVAQLLSAQGRGVQSHYETGIRGAAYEDVQRIRELLYELLRFAVDAASACGAQRGSLTPASSLSPVSSAAVLCGLLDRAWQPRELALFVQLRVVATLVERFVTLFVPVKEEEEEAPSDSTATTGSAEKDSSNNLSQSTALPRGRRQSHVSGSCSTHPAASLQQLRPSSAADSGRRRSSPSGAASRSGSGSVSVELRPVTLTERRHRDHVMAAQQARRSSRSTLVTAAVLHRQSITTTTTATATTAGAVGPDQSPSLGAADGPPLVTAHEAMQATVWLTLKGLLLQATALLTPARTPLLSRVEQTAVMAFVADALAAIGHELQHCRDVLAKAVAETPVLLAQAGNAAVMEPLVTVQDQVDLLCSVIGAVAGTLSTASVNARVAVPAPPSAANVAAEEGSVGGGSDDLFLNAGLSCVCAGVAETLLELVYLDLHHARLVHAESGVGCVVRDAAACARMASLLLCRCQPASVRDFASGGGGGVTSSYLWRAMYASPVFSAVPLAAPASIDDGHRCLQLWLDLCTYAMATSGLSRTTQHTLLAMRRLLHQPAWAAELRGFASAYHRLVQTYVKAAPRERTGEAGGVLELTVLQLHVWTVVLGGQLLGPPCDLGALVSYLDDKDGFQATPAYIVDIDAVTTTTTTAATSASTTTPASATPPPLAPLNTRHVRGSSHFVSKTVAAMTADGEQVRGVVVVPADAAGYPRHEEVSMTTQQLFLPSDEAAAVVVPPYSKLVEHFLLPAIEQCLPLLLVLPSPAPAQDTTLPAMLSVMELSYVTSLVWLTTGVLRARADMARTLIETGAMRLLHRYAIGAAVRLPFPTKILKEWAALVAVRAAEEAAERIYTPAAQHRRDSLGERRVSGDATPITKTTTSGSARAGSSTATGPVVGGAPSSPSPVPVRAPLSASPLPVFSPAGGDAFLETTRSSGGPVLSPLDTSQQQQQQQQLADWGLTTEESLLRLAERFGFMPRNTTTTITTSSTALQNNSSVVVGGGGVGGGSRTPIMTAMQSGLFRNPLSSGAQGSSPMPARLPPRSITDAATGAAMFLSFPMWDAHLSRAAAFALPRTWAHTPAALTITTATPTTHFPLWEDGFAVELAVSLANGDVYPSLGDAVAIPCSSARIAPSDYVEDTLDADCPSPFEFPLLTLVAADPASEDKRPFTFLQLKVHRSCVSVTMHLPRSTETGTREAELRMPNHNRETITAIKALRHEDWHRCMHVALLCSSTGVLLCRNGESVNVALSADAARRLETLLRRRDFIQSVLVGRKAPVTAEERDTALPDGPARAVDGPMAFVAALRLSGTSALRTSVRVAAELVARDQALPLMGLPDLMCAFDFRDGSGSTVHSTDASRKYCGVLSGQARWAIEHLPLGFYPAIELNAVGPRSGVATAPASSVSLPRPTMAALIDSLAPCHFARFGEDVLRSLLIMTARHAALAALEVGVSPAYTLRILSSTDTSPPVRCFDPRQVLDTSQALPGQLLRLLELQDGACLPDASAQLVDSVVQHLVAALVDTDDDRTKGQTSPDTATVVLADAGKGEKKVSSLLPFVRDVGLLLRQLRRDDGDAFLVELPASSSASPPSSATPVALPLAFVNGGTANLSFDPKFRNMEQATFYKDKELKNILAKYPDGQGGWPLCVVSPTESPWTFLRSVPTSAGHRMGLESAAGSANSTASMPSVLTATVKSLKPVIMHAIVRAVCNALTHLLHADTDPQHQHAAQEAAAGLLEGRVVATLLKQSSARSSDDDCVHFVYTLTHLLELWRHMPAVQPHDQLPLAIAMAHLNLPLRGVLHHGSSEADLDAMRANVMGTYSPYVQALLGLWSTAVLTDGAWAGRTYSEQLQARWRRFLRTWRRGAVSRPLPLTSGGGGGDGAASARVLDALSAVAAYRMPSLRTDAASTVSDATVTTSPTLSERGALVSRPRQQPQRGRSGSETGGDALSPLANATPAAAGLCGQQDGEARWKDGCVAEAEETLTLCEIGMVALHPPNSASPPPRLQSRQGAGNEAPFPLSGKSGEPIPVPDGVSRKGNGLWVVRGGSGAVNSSSSADEVTRASATTVRSSVGFRSGAIYWEVTVTNISRAETPAPLSGGGSTLASNVIVGVCTEYFEPAPVASGPDGAGVFIGCDAESWAFDGGRALRYYKGYTLETSPRTRWKPDDVIGVVVDISHNRLCCLHNGRLVSEFNGSFLSQQQRAAEAAVFPVVVCTGAASCEVNFGSASFAATPPPGCLPVDPSFYLNEESARVWQLVTAQELVFPTFHNTGKRSDEHAVPPLIRSTLLRGQASRAAAAAAAAAAPSRVVLTHDALPYVCRHLATFTHGRCGPLDVVPLYAGGSGNGGNNGAEMENLLECKADKEASLVFGSVCVTSGRWYFEVVAPLEPTFSVGWCAWKAVEEHGGRGPMQDAALSSNALSSTNANGVAQLGHDGHSWAFDVSRMMARHNKHQTSLLRRVWKARDVVGCLLDCDAGTMTFTVNGKPVSAPQPGASAATTAGGGVGGSASPQTPLPQATPSQSGQRHSSNSTAANPAPASPAPNESRNGSPPSSPPPLAAASSSSASPAIFAGVSMSATGGLVPALLLEPRTRVLTIWKADAFHYPPADGSYQALDGSHVVRAAFVDMITTNTDATMSAAQPAGTEKRVADAGKNTTVTRAGPTHFKGSALQKLLYHASKVQELNPTSLRSYLMPSLFLSPPSAPEAESSRSGESLGPASSSQAPAPQPQHQQHLRDLCTVGGLDPSQLRSHLALLVFFAHLTTLLFPFAHSAVLPVAVEDSPLGSRWTFHPLQRTLQACQSLAPPWTAQRALQWSLDSSNGAGDLVRLNVNRRKALLVVRDPTASPARRLRDSLFGQVYQLLAGKTPVLFKTNKKMWAVTFYGEGADDVGGPYRECLTQMCAELMGPSLRLFLPTANVTSDLGDVREGFVLNPVCVPPAELLMYRFLGRLMGGCLRGGEPLPLYLPSALWKFLVGDAADDSDVARIDVATLHAIEYVERLAGLVLDSSTTIAEGKEEEEAERNEELAELCPGGFSLLNDAGIVDELVPGGSRIPVTVRNAALYVQLVRDYKLYRCAAPQRRALQQGFHEVVPLYCVAALKWYELEELVCGQGDYDPDALLDAARYEGLAATDIRVVYLRTVLRGFTRHQRALFMRFVSGRERLPPGMQLKIMPDNAPPPRSVMPPPLSPPAQRSVMTPQPPPSSPGETTTSVHASPPPNNRGGVSGGRVSRNGSYVRQHTTLAQSRTDGGGPTAGTPPQPRSPPQLGFTPPPSQSVPLLARAHRRTASPQLRLTRELLTPLTENGAAPVSPSQLHQPQQHISSTRRGSHVQQERAVDNDDDLCDDTRLPHASTCFYWLCLPRYSSAAVMAEKLLFAIEQCVDIDADFRVHDTDVAEQEVGPTLARVGSEDNNLFEDFSHLR